MEQVKNYLRRQGVEVKSIFTATAFIKSGKNLKKAKKGFLVNENKFVCENTLQVFDRAEFALVRKD